MSTDYKLVCVDCKDAGPVIASASISYGFKLWLGQDVTDELKEWLGHRKSSGYHEGHDLRIVNGEGDMPWVTAEDTE